MTISSSPRPRLAGESIHRTNLWVTASVTGGLRLTWCPRNQAQLNYPWWTLSGTSIMRQSGQAGRLRPKSYKTLQAIARKTTLFHREFNDMNVVQGELPEIGCVNEALNKVLPRLRDPARVSKQIAEAVAAIVG